MKERKYIFMVFGVSMISWAYGDPRLKSRKKFHKIYADYLDSKDDGVYCSLDICLFAALPIGPWT